MNSDRNKQQPSSKEEIAIKINEVSYSIPNDWTLSDTVQFYQQQVLNDQQLPVALLLNQNFVVKPDWPKRQLQPNDVLDVLTPVQGG